MLRIQSLTGAWEFRQAGTEAWLPASFPGGVHTDLLALGCIPDPFAGDNEKRVQWVKGAGLDLVLAMREPVATGGEAAWLAQWQDLLGRAAEAR